MRTTILAIVLLFAFEAHLSAATRTFKMVAPGCTDKELFIKIFKMIQDGDGRTAHRLLNRKIREGVCTAFRKGETVFLVKQTTWDAEVLVRRRGQIKEFWVDRNWFE